MDGSGSGLPLMFDADVTPPTPITADSPAIPGENVTLYVTGLGTVDNTMADGAAALFGAQGTVTIGGTVSAGQQATITIQGASYTYTAVANDTLDNVTTNLAALINNSGDPNVYASADITNEIVKLTAIIPGDAGTKITLSLLCRLVAPSQPQ